MKDNKSLEQLIAQQRRTLGILAVCLAIASAACIAAFVAINS